MTDDPNATASRLTQSGQVPTGDASFRAHRGRPFTGGLHARQGAASRQENTTMIKTIRGVQCVPAWPWEAGAFEVAEDGDWWRSATDSEIYGDVDLTDADMDQMDHELSLRDKDRS